jgi:hypothetical protein
MKYKCIKEFRTIQQCDIVDVLIMTRNQFNPVYITKGSLTHCTNYFVLDEHFIKDGK